MSHEADKWIESKWMGKDVRQALTVEGCSPMVGVSEVVGTMWDEKGALHLNMANGYWCPARIMELVV
jgi:hypothetical protein